MKQTIQLSLMFAMLTAMLLMRAPHAQSRFVVARQDAPVVLAPEPGRTPLYTVRAGTSMTLVGTEGQWVKVEFEDPRLGRRTGYVELRFVSIAPTADAPSPVAPAAAAPTVKSPLPEPSPVVDAPKARPVTSERRGTLSTNAIRDAIQVGHQGKNREHGLALTDSLSAFGNIGGNSTSSTGFSVVLYTPTTWIRFNAALSAKRYQQLSVEDVDEEMLEPVLRVIANPDTPRQVTAAGARGTSSVEHIVLQDKNRNTTIQPTWTETFDVEAANALGGRLGYKGMRAEFNLDSLREIRGRNNDQEFYVVVIGNTGEEKKFEVKKKHFERLP